MDWVTPVPVHIEESSPSTLLRPRSFLLFCISVLFPYCRVGDRLPRWVQSGGEERHRKQRCPVTSGPPGPPPFSSPLPDGGKGGDMGSRGGEFGPLGQKRQIYIYIIYIYR